MRPCAQREAFPLLGILTVHSYKGVKEEHMSSDIHE